MPDRMDVERVERPRVLALAEQALAEPVVCLPDRICPRSPGSPHDYYSEAPYFWPDPENPEGPFIRRDGLVYPQRFAAHQQAVSRLNRLASALAAAYLLTRDQRFATRAAAHLRAWFLDPATRMNPSLAFTQAIPGRCTGRGIGIIDTKHFAELVRAIAVVENAGVLTPQERNGLRGWFRQYLAWLTTHPFGLQERDHGNNHSTYWAVQVAAFARFVGDDEQLASCRRLFRETLLPGQMASDGSFPQELGRSRSLGYSIFNLNGMAALCQQLSTDDDDLWRFEMPDGRGMRRGTAFLFPYLLDKSRWPHGQDAEIHDELPGRPVALLLAGLALGETSYLEHWQRLPEPPAASDWTSRAVCFRQPLLWMPS